MGPRHPPRHRGRPHSLPEQVDAFTWTPEDEARVADHLEGHVVGAPGTVVSRLEALARVTGAEEILVTTATYRAADRYRSYELLAQAWRDRPAVHLPEPAHATA